MITQAPDPVLVYTQRRLFLAGSIEQGKAEQWQDKVAYQLQYKYDILNPRRDDWNDSWEQSYSNIQFRDQVYWEQSNLNVADAILFHFVAGTVSPITLLEFGQHIEDNNKIIVVSCPTEYFRYGNIEFMCHWAGKPLFNKLEDAVYHLEYSYNK